MIQFTCHGQSVSLAPGQHFARPHPVGFRDTPSAELQSIIAEVDAGRPWREVVNARYAAGNPWLNLVVTDPIRTAFFDQVLPTGTGPVLDVGAGWGQISRPLAARRPVVSLEPVSERLGFIRAAALQDGVAQNMAFVEAGYFEIEFATRFSAICAIGVLEWAGAFQQETEPQERQRAFLRKARHELAAGGSLVIGIENRLGLKYLLGVPDDHIGVPHIAYLPAAVATRRWRESSGHVLQSFTYSLSELKDLLRDAGFTQLAFFAAFPDYKLPRQIVAIDDHGAALNRAILERPLPPEHNGYNGGALDPATQEAIAATYRSLAGDGIAHHFAPSFFVRAS